MRFCKLFVIFIAFGNIAHSQATSLADNQKQCTEMFYDAFNAKGLDAMIKKHETLPAICKEGFKQKADSAGRAEQEAKEQELALKLVRAKERAKLNPLVPTPVDMPTPKYPPQAIRQRLEGVVVLHVFVGINGRVSNASIKASSGSPVLDQAAIDVTASWSFMPAVKDGVLAPAEMTIPLDFSLNEI
jgi:TonB family protein